MNQFKIVTKEIKAVEWSFPVCMKANSVAFLISSETEGVIIYHDLQFSGDGISVMAKSDIENRLKEIEDNPNRYTAIEVDDFLSILTMVQGRMLTMIRRADLPLSRRMALKDTVYALIEDKLPGSYELQGIAMGDGIHCDIRIDLTRDDVDSPVVKVQDMGFFDAEGKELYYDLDVAYLEQFEPRIKSDWRM